ncbi:RDD family protein [Nocardiopsis ansamitocini]|nr:RDD family protein [Nocardiopsis ansamitocini]
MGDAGGRDGRAGTFGPGDADETQFEYRGNRLGRPESGSGSVPGFGRRVVALIIDWLLASLLASALFGAPSVFAPAPEGGTPPSAALLPVAVFAVMVIVLLTLFGTTAGKLLTGSGLAATGERALPWPVAMIVRTVLLCLVVPAVVYDRDQRGLHDRLAGTISVRL